MICVSYFQYTQHSLAMLVPYSENRHIVLEESMETGKRSLLKAAIWQAMGLLIKVLIGYLYTGSLASGGAIAGINTVIGMTTYLIYERVWARVSWGRMPTSLISIGE
jgi:uncharacterized membrane protein